MDADERLIKTQRFATRTYVGDPLNVVRLFNEREVDELVLLDIDASAQRRSPNFAFIETFASECFMPLAYGGGISSLDDCRTLNRLGVEKVVLRSHAQDVGLIEGLVAELGTQAVVTCIDYRGSGRQAVTVDGKPAVQVAADMVRRGVGEVVLQSIDHDGMRSGFDLPTIELVANAISAPLIALGGGGDLSHMRPAFEAGAAAAASGSAFSFIGRLRAVLVNYPSQAEIDIVAGGY
ncbi:HisA/HisF-related TIM barrel protein [Devosia riboflavina]